MQVSELPLADDTGLPASFKCKPSDSLLAAFKTARSKLGLASPFAFSVDCSSLQGGVVLHLLLGRIQPASEPEGIKGSTTSAPGNQTPSIWVGLLGVGIWS